MKKLCTFVFLYYIKEDNLIFSLDISVYFNIAFAYFLNKDYFSIFICLNAKKYGRNEGLNLYCWMLKKLHLKKRCQKNNVRN